MKIKTDSYYVIGKSHNYCQDYAYAYHDKICLSDGCSLISKDGICTPHKTSDIAARLLCKMSVNLLYPSILYIDNISLDATYLECSYLKDNTVKLTIIGDGVVYLKDLNNEEKVIIRSYNPNTPLYMSYVYDEQARNIYEKFKPILTERVINLTTGEDISNQIENSPYYNNNIQTLENIKSISLFSDGVTDIYGIDIKDAVIALTSFKRTNNQFVMARMKAQLREWNSQGIYPNDDLSMATLIIEE